jgi:hypothetical protein
MRTEIGSRNRKKSIIEKSLPTKMKKINLQMLQVHMKEVDIRLKESIIRERESEARLIAAKASIMGRLGEGPLLSKGILYQNAT